MPTRLLEIVIVRRLSSCFRTLYNRLHWLADAYILS